MIFCTYYDERHLMNTQNPHTIINAKKTLKVVAVSWAEDETARFLTSLTRKSKRVSCFPPTSNKNMEGESTSKTQWLKSLWCWIKLNRTVTYSVSHHHQKPSNFSYIHCNVHFLNLLVSKIYNICSPSRREPVRMGSDTMIIPVPLQTYFMRNCSNITYHSRCEKIVFIWSTREPYALSRWLSSTYKSIQIIFNELI